VVTATVDIKQCYSVVCVEFIVVTAKLDTVKFYSVLCGDYCSLQHH